MSAACGKPSNGEESASVSGPVIAVVVVFATVLVVVASCALRSYLCKSNALCFGANEREVDGSSGCRSSGFVEFHGGSMATEDGLNGTDGSERQTFHTATSWVGQDFRIVPPKPKSKRPVIT